MSWEALGAIAELVGSVAVVATIGYLIVQIRQNTRFAQIDAAQQLRGGMNDVLRGITDNEDVVRIWQKALNDASTLESHERVRFDLIILQMLRVSESLYLLYVDGFLSEESWESLMRALLVPLESEGGRQSWQRQRHVMSNSFRDYVDGALEQGLPPTAGGG
jgi:hypothetical protein